MMPQAVIHEASRIMLCPSPYVSVWATTGIPSSDERDIGSASGRINADGLIGGDGYSD
jgi:hypothetical protein